MAGERVIKPIGYLQSELNWRYETPRQGVLAGDNMSVIKLEPGQNFEQAAKDLEGFDRIWVIYNFHLNKNWKPQVTPPRYTRKKIGVFATRAPYRPNHIGLSCVKLVKVDGLNVYIAGADILNGTPILDIKPYLPYSDSFPDSATGWVKSGFDNRYEVIFEEEAEKQAGIIKSETKTNLICYIQTTLLSTFHAVFRQGIGTAGALHARLALRHKLAGPGRPLDRKSTRLNSSHT